MLTQSAVNAERPSKPNVEGSGILRGGLKQPLTLAATAQARKSVKRRAVFMVSGSISGSIDVSGRADETRLVRRRSCLAGLTPVAVFDVAARRYQRFKRRA